MLNSWKNSTYGGRVRLFVGNRGSGQRFAGLGRVQERWPVDSSTELRCFLKAYIFGTHEKWKDNVFQILDGAMEKDFDIVFFLNVCVRKW